MIRHVQEKERKNDCFSAWQISCNRPTLYEWWPAYWPQESVPYRHCSSPTNDIPNIKRHFLLAKPQQQFALTDQGMISLELRCSQEQTTLTAHINCTVPSKSSFQRSVLSISEVQYTTHTAAVSKKMLFLNKLIQLQRQPSSL